MASTSRPLGGGIIKLGDTHYWFGKDRSQGRLKAVGSKTASVIFMGDMWKPRTQWDSRSLWMTVEIGDGRLWLPEPKEWTLNIATGEMAIAK